MCSSTIRRFRVTTTPRPRTCHRSASSVGKLATTLLMSVPAPVLVLVLLSVVVLMLVLVPVVLVAGSATRRW